MCLGLGGWGERTAGEKIMDFGSGFKVYGLGHLGFEGLGMYSIGVRVWCLGCRVHQCPLTLHIG